MLELKGKGLFVFSDPGGAKGVLAQVYELKEVLTSYLVVSDRSFSFFDDFDVKVLDSGGIEISQLFEDFQPDFVFTGTSYTSTIELEFIKFANTKGIVTYSFVDHWTNFRSRFITGAFSLFPDKVLVIDNYAQELASQEGIPLDKLEVFGHPYYKFLQLWKPVLKRTEFYRRINVSENKKLILYAPDPLTNVGGIEKYGCDEISGLEFLLKQLTNFENMVVMIKPHPNQDVSKFENYLKQNPQYQKQCLLLNNGISLNLLIYYSSCVISFFSNVLNEAKLLHKMSISLYLSEQFEIKSFKSNVYIIRDGCQLKEILNEI